MTRRWTPCRSWPALLWRDRAAVAVSRLWARDVRVVEHLLQVSCLEVEAIRVVPPLSRCDHTRACARRSCRSAQHRPRVLARHALPHLDRTVRPWPSLLTGSRLGCVSLSRFLLRRNFSQWSVWSCVPWVTSSILVAGMHAGPNHMLRAGHGQHCRYYRNETGYGSCQTSSATLRFRRSRSALSCRSVYARGVCRRLDPTPNTLAHNRRQQARPSSGADHFLRLPDSGRMVQGEATTGSRPKPTIISEGRAACCSRSSEASR